MSIYRRNLNSPTINTPKVVTFRITSKCENNCAYCYGPKDKADLNFDSINLIFRRLKLFGVRSIVLTGGDPLLRTDIAEILRLLKKLGLNIFLDTSGTNFFSYNYLIDNVVSDLGLPLDSIIYRSLYRTRENYTNRIRILEYYKNHRGRIPRIRIGTVMSEDNMKDLNSIGKFLSGYPIASWKLYQFIPIGKNAKFNRKKFELDDEAFLSKAYELNHIFSDKYKVVVSPRARRASAYFMIDPDGTVYSPTDNGFECKEKIIGNIFDDDILEKWNQDVETTNYVSNAGKTFSNSFSSLPMKNTYLKMLDAASVYYADTNDYVFPHVRWMVREALSIIQNTKIDESIFLPLIILHDIGYAKTCRNPFLADSRVEHMKAGKILSLKILESLNYPRSTSHKIADSVGKHDNFAFGETSIYQKNKELGVFHDLHYSSMLSDESFYSMTGFYNDKNKKVMDYLDPKISNSHTFRSKITCEIHEKYLTERKFQLLSER